MKKIYFLLVMVTLLALTACAPAPQAGDLTQSPRTAETPTVANTPIPSQEPTPASLPTFSLATVDSPLTPLPTFSFNNTPIPFSTTTSFITRTPYVGPPEADCFVTASKEGIHMNPGPFISAYRLLPTMELGVRYQVVDMYPTFYQLALDGVPIGWVEYITSGLSSEGTSCVGFFDRLPDSRSLTDFAGLCFFTVARPTETFQDSALTEPHFIHLPASPYAHVVLWKSQKSYFTSLSHAGPSFYVPANNVSMFGDCAGIPTSATVTTAGWLWSEPDESRGEKLIRLTVGLHLRIEGLRPPEGAWVYALVENQSESMSGWVWSALLSID